MMESAKKIDTNGRRSLLYGKLRGMNEDGTQCVPVKNWSKKIQKVLLDLGEERSVNYVNQVLWGNGFTNDLVLDAADVVLVQHERALKELKKKKKKMLQPI